MSQIDTALIFRSWYEFANTLQPERRAEFYTKVVGFMLDEIEPDWNGDELLQGFWMGAKPNALKSIKNKKNGAKGGRPPKKETQEKRGVLTQERGVLTPEKSYMDMEMDIKKEINKEKKVCPNCGDAIVQKDDGSFVCFACHWEGSLTE